LEILFNFIGTPLNNNDILLAIKRKGNIKLVLLLDANKNLRILSNESEGFSISEQIKLIASAPVRSSSSLRRIAPLMSISYPFGISGGLSLASLI
tara:strand:- start:305 stop:589 length:285 start_codon:yes stop_codon:yes gene_type:complete